MDLDLDLYVGTLTRFYIGDWDAVLQPGSRGPGEELLVVRIGDNGHETPDPVAVRESVLEWQSWATDEVDVLEAPLEWPEERDVPYFTDKPTVLGLGALQLWAAYAEHPDLARPERIPEDWLEDAALQRSMEDGFPTRYPHLLFQVDVWLPVRMAEVFDAPHPLGEDDDEQIRYGSVPALLEELEDLNARTWRAGADEIERWRVGGLDAEATLEARARFAYSVFLELATKADEFGLPMVLD